MDTAGKRTLYVLHRHDWGPHPHWDFMLEVPGQELLRTFQFPFEPTLEEARRGLPCREIKGHARKYLTYEGPVSRGRGTVSIVDAGGCFVVSRSPRMLHLRLHSERGYELREWVLHFVGGPDWVLRAPAEIPFSVTAHHIPVVRPPIDPLHGSKVPSV